MKEAVAYCLSWMFFWIGDFLSKVLDTIDLYDDDSEPGKVFEFLYKMYQKSMFLSDTIQQWGCPDTGPWEEVDMSKLEENGEEENVHQPDNRN